MNKYLTLHYEFRDVADLGKDSSCFGHNGKACSAVSLVEGRRDRVLRFNSSEHKNSDAYMEIPVEAIKHNEITLMAWAKYDITNVGHYARLFSIETEERHCLQLMAITGYAISGYTALLQSSSEKAVVKTEGRVPANVYADWHHVALTYDGSEAKVYVNGTFVNSTKVSTDLESWNIYKAYIGKTGIWDDGSYNGYMDDVRVYSKALSEDQIADISGILADTSTKVTKLLSSLEVDGKELTEFNAFSDAYYSVLPQGTERVPTVTATAPYDGTSIEIVPAKSLPGTTKIHISYASGVKRTVTVFFTVFGAELEHPVIEDVIIDDPFWSKKLKQFCEVTAPYVLNSWATKNLDNMQNFARVASGHRNTKDYVQNGMTWGEGDFYAALAGACRLLRQHPNEKLKKQVMGYVDQIFAASETVENGYFCPYHLLETDGKVFTETQNAAAHGAIFQLGYLLEFGMALYEATGDARMLRAGIRFLNFTVKYSDHGKRNFVAWHQAGEFFIVRFVGWIEAHPEVQMSSYLSDLIINTNDYRELMNNLFSLRGVHADRASGHVYGSYNNDHLPFTKLNTATGHAAGSQHLYSALAEYGRLTGDLSYISAAYRLYENLVNRQMYITGSAGWVLENEALGGDYQLPNESYSEGCSAGALILYSDSLASMFADHHYHAIIEKTLYNTLLGCVGENGITFTYENPLAKDMFSRWSWHAVPCCTKYYLLITGELPRYIYSCTENDVYVNQYIGNTATLSLSLGKVILKQTANWAEKGVASITITCGAKNLSTLNLRLPEWSENTNILLNGEAVTCDTVNGYAVIHGAFEDGDTVSVSADISVKRVYSNKNVKNNVGRVAIQKGPLIFCMEGVDHLPIAHYFFSEKWLVLPSDATFSEKKIDDLYDGVTALTTKALIIQGQHASRSYDLTLVPFYARGNRCPGPVHVWLAEDPSLINDSPLLFLD